MLIIHTQKYVKTSPKKLRRVADLVRNMDVREAIEMTPFVGRRASEPIEKVLKAAVGIASARNLTGKLIVKEIQVGEGPDLKRGRPVSRGRWHPYKRRMSHIRVVLESKEEKIPTKSSKKPTKKIAAKKTTSSKTKSKTKAKTQKKGSKK